MCATNRARSASGKGSALIASVAVPIAALWVSAPDIMPAAKPASSFRIFAMRSDAESAVMATIRVSKIGLRPSRLSACMNCGPTE
jgi:hypothetical protein